MLTDDDKYELINLWEGEDILYDICNADYRNKTKRNAAVKRIAEEMTADISDDEVNFSSAHRGFLKRVLVFSMMGLTSRTNSSNVSVFIRRYIRKFSRSFNLKGEVH